MNARRPHALVLAALIPALLGGCLLDGLPIAPTDERTEGTIKSGLQTQVGGAVVKGTVKMPATHLSADGKTAAKYGVAAVTNYKGVVGAGITLRNYAMKTAPNSPSGRTDGKGAFSMRGVPTEQVWLLVADYGGIKGANLVVPKAKKTTSVDITLGSTLAAAALVPLLAPTSGKTTDYDLNDIDINLFYKLVEAVEATLGNDTAYKAGKELKDIVGSFNQIKTNNAAVRTAYEKLIGVLNENATERLGKAPTNKGDEGTGGDGSASDSVNPDPNATDTETPEVNMNPLMGNVAAVGSSGLESDVAGQMAVMTVLGQQAIVIPDDDEVVAIVAGVVQRQPLKVGDKPVTGVRTIAQGEGSKAYCIGTVDGTPSLITLTISGTTPTATAVPLKAPSQGAIGTITGLAYHAANSKLFAVDETKHCVYGVSTSSSQTEATLTLAVGAYGVAGNDLTTTATATSVRLNKPTSIAVSSQGTMYIADSVNHRIVVVNLVSTTGAVSKLAGFNFGFTNGKRGEAQFNYPTSLALKDDFLYVGEIGNNAIRRVSLSSELDQVISLASSAVGDAKGGGLVTGPRSLVAKGEELYVVAGDGSIKKFTATGQAAMQ